MTTAPLEPLPTMPLPSAPPPPSGRRRYERRCARRPRGGASGGGRGARRARALPLSAAAAIVAAAAFVLAAVADLPALGRAFSPAAPAAPASPPMVLGRSRESARLSSSISSISISSRKKCARRPTPGGFEGAPSVPGMASQRSGAEGEGGGQPPEALATEGDWSAYLDGQVTGLVYYFNARTGESRWAPPTPTFPPVKLPRKVRRAAESKQEEYRRAAAARQQQEQESQKRGGGGILSALLLGDDEDDREDSLSSVATAEKKEEWFDFLSDRPPAASSPAAEPAEAPRQKSDSDWFGWGKAREGKAVRADWFASFGTSAADGPPAGSDVAVGESAAEELSFSAAAEEAGTLIEEKKVKEEADWFSWFQPKGESGRDADVPGTAVGASAPTAAVEEAPTTAAEPAPTEPAEKQPEAEPQKPRPSVLGKLFGSVPAVSVDIPKPLGAERIKPDAVVEKPRPVVLEKPEPAVVEKPKPAAIVEPPPKKEDRRAAAVEVGAPPAVIAPEMSTYVLPDPKKLFWGGEDAVFVRGRTFGVFDGVSGADKLDGLPLYSITLAREMKSRVGVDGLQVKDMVDLLSESVEVANQRATGASTALVGSIGEDGVLQVLNVGDSTAVVVRENKVVARTREINHFYECPYQFSTSSPDRPRDGTRLRLALKRGDVIIAGSDGVFDNLEEEQILDELRKSPKKASVIAKRVSDLSRRVSQNPKAVTPFSRLALQKKNPDYPDGVGGKVDDVCCVAICYG